MLRRRLWSVSTIALDTGIERQQLSRQADSDLVRRTFHGAWAATICFLILVASTSYFQDHPTVVTAAGLCLLFVFSFRIRLSRWEKFWNRSYSLWRNLYFSTVVLSGTCWGIFFAATIWLYGIDHGTTLLFLACMLTICSAAPVTLAPNLTLMSAFLATAVFPAVAIYCAFGGVHGWTMVGGAIAFLAFSLIQGASRNQEYWNSLRAIAMLERREEQRNQAEAALRRAHDELERRIRERTSELVTSNLVLRTHKEQLAALFEQAADCVLVATYDAILLEVNASGCAMTGYSREELVGQSAFMLLRPEDVILMHPVLEQVQSGRAVWGETQILRKDRTLVPVEFSAQLLSDSRLMAFVRDVTQRKEADEAQRASEERWRSVFENSAIGISLTDLNGMFIATNPAYQRMVGYTDEELRHLSYTDVTLEQDRERNEMLRAELLQGKRSEFKLEKRNRRKDGSLMWARVTCSITPESKRVPRYMMAIVEDITERKRAEESARRAQRALQELSGRLIRLQDTERRHLARELHDTTAQNIVALGMKLEILMGETTDDRSRTTLAESLALAEQCLKEVRTFSYVLHPPVLDDLGLQSALSWYLKGFVDRSGIKVQLDMPSNLGRLPQEMETALYRVVQESLTNIYRHSGSRTAGIRITRRAREILLEVEDQGRGMNGQSLKHRYENAELTGVGIASMRERVRKVGGQFEILTGKDGTSVRVILPLPTAVAVAR